MPRPPSAEIARRNDRIYAEWLAGASLTALGEKYQLARQVVGRVVAKYHPEEGEDDDRALYRGYMWRLYEEVQQIGDKPGFKMRPDGNPAYGPDKELALDTQVQVQAKELQLKILRELRLLDGRDRPQKRELHVSIPEAEQQKNAAIARERARLEELARRAGQAPPVVAGEVVREIGPAATSP